MISPASRPLVSAGLLIGAGLGGLVDGILFRQILQWHNMFSGWMPSMTLVETRINLFWDGVFLAGVWTLTTAGIVLLFKAGHRADARWSGRTLLGSCVAGWGLFNVIEGGLNHLLLDIHHIHEYARDPMAWDLGFLAGGVLLIVLGWQVARTG